jgi:hypothetical protein
MVAVLGEDMKRSRCERTDHFVEHIAQFDFNHGLVNGSNRQRKEMHVFVFFSRVLPKLGGELVIWRIIALEIIAHALRIALAATIKIQHPAVRYGIRHQLPVETSLDGVNDAGH